MAQIVRFLLPRRLPFLIPHFCVTCLSTRLSRGLSISGLAAEGGDPVLSQLLVQPGPVSAHHTDCHVVFPFPVLAAEGGAPVLGQLLV